MWRRLMQALVLTQGPFVMGPIELGLNRASLIKAILYLPTLPFPHPSSVLLRSERGPTQGSRTNCFHASSSESGTS
jgi:hypothetical protein